MSHIDSYTQHAHLVPLHPQGRPLTEDHHDERAAKQRLLVETRIAELMAGENPLHAIMESKLAHRDMGLDDLFDEAIEELRQAFKLDKRAINDASADAFRRERERREAVRKSARAAARRAGLEIEDDEISLAPRSRKIKVENAKKENTKNAGRFKPAAGGRKRS